MKSILNELYYGRIVPWERGIPKTPEYKEANKDINKEKAFFKQILSEEEYKRLEVLENMYTNTSDIESADAFSYGFRLGLLIMIDVFSTEKPCVTE